MEELMKQFEEIYQRQDYHSYFSPGRVNLIGEHTDYNGGHVFPAAITLGNYGLIALRSDRQVNCVSTNFPNLGIITFDLDNLEFQAQDEWVNYVKGMIKFLKESGTSIDRGFDLLVEGNIPNGAGLSSSASLELLIGYALNDLFQGDNSRQDLAFIGQKVENQFIGVNSGIMDQFAIAMGQADQAIFLDVNTMDYEMVPADFKNYQILIMNTNKRRELADSKYNQRRKECEQALSLLQSQLDITALGQLTPEEFEANAHDLIDDETLYKRAKHAVYENQRTIEAKDKLTQGDLDSFGQLLNQSHLSLKDNYDVTGKELDTLVETAWLQEGVLGARMTGAGMGGCAIALVHTNRIDEVADAIQKVYESRIGYPAGFFVAEIGNGVAPVNAKEA